MQLQELQKYPFFGSHVTGRDALNLAVEIRLSGIAPTLDEAFIRYTSPLPPEFAWVDNIKRVKDTELIAVLDSYLNDELANPTDSVLWLGEPEIVDWESQIGYSFDLRSNTLRHVVLSLKNLLHIFIVMGKL